MMAEVRKPDKEEIEAARERLRGVLVPTPLLPFPVEEGPPVWLKPECLQPTGSFKVRGVYNAVARMPPAVRARGLSTVSAGNTAKALAWTARRFGVPARSILPEKAPAAKIEAVRALGATPVLLPTPEVFRFLREARWEREPYAFVHPWIDRDVLVGHGTIGLEILAERPEVDTVLVPIGGGGLFGGVASALKALRPGIRVLAVEPEGCPAFHAARAAGRPVEVACETECDGVAVPYVTGEMFPLLSELADGAVLVSEAEVRSAVRLLAAGARLVSEPSGALALAAALRLAPAERGRAAALVTGGSIGAERLAELLAAE